MRDGYSEHVPFTRTDSGISNQYLFYEVDFMVYCEGEPKGNETATLDEMFWQRIFSDHGKKVHCVSKGGKNNLLSEVKKLKNGDIDNVVVAMDRDYDEFLGEMINHPKVFYTYGYSFESDLVQDFPIQSALTPLATIIDTGDIECEFLDFKKKSSLLLRRICALDFKYFRHPEPLFDRKKPASIINTCSWKKEPKIKTNTMLSNAKKMKKLNHCYKATFLKSVYKSICGMRYFYGKTVAHLVYKWFIYRTKNMLGVGNVRFELFMRNITSQMDVKDRNIPRNAYYSTQMAKL